MKFNVHGGHNKIVQGASKFLNEVTEDRKVKNEVIRLLKLQGHTVYDCTDDVGKTQNDNLKNIVKKCNAHSVDLDVSIHLNSDGGEGVEVYTYNNGTKVYATRICDKISKSLDIKNRGVKNGSGLYVLKNTRAQALLIECCFVDSKNDSSKWDAKKCAKAIVEGILNKSISTSTTTPSIGASYLVKVANVSKGDTLNVRVEPNPNSKIAEKLKYNDPNKYTIVETKKVGSQTWGLLKGYSKYRNGWINLYYTKKV